jgi:putative IMPACT (imprinted ancient) family translation regulator
MQAEDTYRTIEGTTTGLYKEKGSKFIAIAMPVYSRMPLSQFLTIYIRSITMPAPLLCIYYWFKGERWRINDDGEPSGTAGKPIHGQLLSFNLTNILVVVVRYFGGTKLGVSG